MERQKSLCQALGFSYADEGSELVLRTLLHKGVSRDVQGLACLNLARLLSQRADQVPDPTGTEATQARRRGEGLFASVSA